MLVGFLVIIGCLLYGGFGSHYANRARTRFWPFVWAGIPAVASWYYAFAGSWINVAAGLYWLWFLNYHRRTFWLWREFIAKHRAEWETMCARLPNAGKEVRWLMDRELKPDHDWHLEKEE